MISIVASAETSKMAAGLTADMAMSPYRPASEYSVYILYGMAALGILTLVCSLYCFYKIGRIPADKRSEIKKLFIGGILLFIFGSFLLAYFSYTAGQHRIPYLGHPGFDPRVT